MIFATFVYLRHADINNYGNLVESLESQMGIPLNCLQHSRCTKIYKDSVLHVKTWHILLIYFNNVDIFGKNKYSLMTYIQSGQNCWLPSTKVTEITYK